MTSNHRQKATVRATLVSTGVNILLTTVQVLAGFLTGSRGLIADGLHSLADLVSDGVVLLISRYSHKDPDPEHPYGHYRFETAGSLFLGLLLVGTGASMISSVIPALHSGGSSSLAGPEALWVALGALVVKEGLFRYMFHVARTIKSRMLAANAWHARSDAASSLVVALGLLGQKMGYNMADGLAALVVGGMIIRMGGKLAWEALGDLMDRSANQKEVLAIRQTLLETPGVLGIHDVRTRKMGDMILVDAHIEVDALITVEEGHDIGACARQRVMERHRVLDVMTHIDPAHRPDRDHDGAPEGSLKKV
jgi:cation diffusion facilitator family transporter